MHLRQPEVRGRQIRSASHVILKDGDGFPEFGFGGFEVAALAIHLTEHA